MVIGMLIVDAFFSYWELCELPCSCRLIFTASIPRSSALQAEDMERMAAASCQCSGGYQLSNITHVRLNCEGGVTKAKPMANKRDSLSVQRLKEP